MYNEKNVKPLWEKYKYLESLGKAHNEIESVESELMVNFAEAIWMKQTMLFC